MATSYSAPSTTTSSSTVFPKYKLTYFNGRGLAEITRLLFAYAGVEYEDVRIEKDQYVETEKDQDVETEKEQDVETEKDQDVETENDQDVETENDQDVETENDEDVETENDEDVETDNDEDVETEMDQDVETENVKWAELKPATPFGKLPTLEINGTIISESRAIARYVAMEHGLAGKTNLEAAKCDMLVDAVYDVIICALAKWWEETDRDVKTATFNTFLSEDFPPFVEFLNSILIENDEGYGYFVGDKLTWADVAVAHALYSVDIIDPDQHHTIISRCPLLQFFVARITHLHKINNWINKRPVTAF